MLIVFMQMRSNSHHRQLVAEVQAAYCRRKMHTYLQYLIELAPAGGTARCHASPSRCLSTR